MHNDPARTRQRYSLLRRLNREGINKFDVYRIEIGEMPERYPVFLRTESSHAGPVSGLLNDKASLQSAIVDALASGIPERHLIAVEYAAEPLADGIFRKMAAFRVGNRIVPTTSVHGRSWIAKQGERGAAGEALYQQENQMLRSNPHASALMRAFTLANIEYGRADFGLVGGDVQIYEINTNPALPAGKGSHPSKMRRDSQNYCWDQYMAALWEIDTSGGNPISLRAPKVDQRRRKLSWRPSYNRALSTP
jgi:hypothetical protein